MTEPYVKGVATAGPTTPAARRGPVVAALMLGMGLAAIDGTIVSTAVPQIVGDLGGLAVFSWLFSGYLLAVTVTLPVYGKLSDTFGRKPVLIAGVVLFLIGSLLCAAAWNMTSLIAFRVVQGLGGGALQGTIQTIAADLYPLKERPKIQAKLSSVWAASSVAGPAAAWPPRGLRRLALDLPDQPAGGACGVVADRQAPEGTGAGGPRDPGTRVRIDWAGALAIFATGALLLTALVQGGVAWPWLSAPSSASWPERPPSAPSRWSSNGARPNRSSPAGSGAAARYPPSTSPSARWACSWSRRPSSCRRTPSPYWASGR